MLPQRLKSWGVSCTKTHTILRNYWLSEPFVRAAVGHGEEKLRCSLKGITWKLTNKLASAMNSSRLCHLTFRSHFCLTYGGWKPPFAQFCTRQAPRSLRFFSSNGVTR